MRDWYSRFIPKALCYMFLVIGFSTIDGIQVLLLFVGKGDLSMFRLFCPMGLGIIYCVFNNIFTKKFIEIKIIYVTEILLFLILLLRYAIYLSYNYII